MTAEWMPVNPCDTCPDKPCSFGCMPYAGYYDGLKAQGKLLGYQIKTIESNLGGNLQIAVTTWLKSMLKQLEDLK